MQELEFKTLEPAEQRKIVKRYRSTGAAGRMSLEDFIKTYADDVRVQKIEAAEAEQTRVYREHAMREAAERSKAANMTPEQAVAAGINRQAYVSVGGDGAAWLKANAAVKRRVLAEGRADAYGVHAQLLAKALAEGSTGEGVD